jgi:DNA polymerase-3 subunit gamma/tau
MYLRWRPRRFEDVIGQEHVTRTLRNAVKRGRLAHAYLLTGPRGTGKTSVARILYRAATCANPVDGDPCNVCPTCVAALEGRSMDLIEIDAASNRGIDDIRDLREKVAYRPSEGRYRVYIVDEAHELTVQAWDAFLKTLEEPPEHAIFVLATTESHKVPATIVSRCQRFDFRRIPLVSMRAHLAQVAEAVELDIEPAVLDRLAHAARGGLRDALSLLDQLAAYGGQRIDMAAARAALGMPSLEAVQRTIRSVGQRDAAGVIATLGDVVEAGADIRQYVEELEAQLRALMLVRVGATASLSTELDEAEIAWLEEEAPSWPLGALLRLIGALAEALARLRDSQHLQIQVELALLEATQPRVETDDQGTAPSAPRSAVSAMLRDWPSAYSAPSMTAAPVPQAKPAQEVARAAPSRASDVHESADAREAGGGSATVAAAQPPPPKPVYADGSGANLARLREAWPDVLEAVKAMSNNVHVLLTTARPRELNATGTLVIAVDPGRRNERLSKEHGTRDTIQKAIQQVVGATLKVQCVVGGDEAGDLLEDPVIRFAVKTFGGEPRREPAEHPVPGSADLDRPTDDPGQ